MKEKKLSCKKSQDLETFLFSPRLLSLGGPFLKTPPPPPKTLLAEQTRPPSIGILNKIRDIGPALILVHNLPVYPLTSEPAPIHLLGGSPTLAWAALQGGPPLPCHATPCFTYSLFRDLVYTGRNVISRYRNPKSMKNNKYIGCVDRSSARRILLFGVCVFGMHPILPNSQV